MNGILEALLKALLEVLLEIALKGPGYLIVKWLRPKSDANPDGCFIVICSIAFWLLVGLGIWGIIVLRKMLGASWHAASLSSFILFVCPFAVS